MSDTDDTLEDELRALLARVLSVQLDELKAGSEKLSGAVSALSNNLFTLNKRFKDIHDLYDDAGSLKGAFTTGNAALTLQMKHLHCLLAETLTALGAQSQEGRQELLEASRTSVTKVIDALGLALNVVQQSADDRSRTLEQTMVELARSFDEKSALTQSRLSALERRIGLLDILSITAVIVLVVAVAGAGAIYLGVTTRQFPR